MELQQQGLRFEKGRSYDLVMTVGCGLGTLRDCLSVGVFERPTEGWRFVQAWEIGIWVIGILSGTLFSLRRFALAWNT